MSGLDYTVMAVYFAIVLAIGAYFARRTDDAGGYFLGRHDISEQALQTAIAESSFDKLRQVEASGGRADFGRSLKPGNTADPDSFKVRKGKVGGFAEELSEPDILYCNEVMERQGYAEALSACRRLCYPAEVADSVADNAASAARHG